MGWLRKKGRQLRKGIKKIGRKIGKAFKSILKPFAKVFNKFGPLGSIAMMMILPGLGQMLAGFGSGWVTSTLGQFAGKAVSFVGNAINFVATAPQKIFQTITGGISNAWNGLLGRTPASQGTWLSGTGTYTDTTGLMGKELFQAEAANTAAPGSWWESFTNDMRNTWGNRGTVNADNLFVRDKAGQIVGEGNFWDVSKAGENRIAKFKGEVSDMGQDIKNVFKTDPRKPMTEATAKTTFNKTEFADFMKNGGNKTHILDREGVVGNVRDFVGGTTSKISDVTVPGVGDVGDVAWGGSTAISAYNAYSAINPKEIEGAGGSGLGILAEDQLSYASDQGGLYNTSAPTWSYDSSASIAQNQTNAVNAWNTNYNLPQGFDPMGTPGYGWNYEQWLQQQLAA
jgi:hypothetical protein